MKPRFRLVRQDELFFVFLERARMNRPAKALPPLKENLVLAMQQFVKNYVLNYKNPRMHLFFFPLQPISGLLKPEKTSAYKTIIVSRIACKS